MNSSTSQLLHPWLREHHRREEVKATIPNSLLGNSSPKSGRHKQYWNNGNLCRHATVEGRKFGVVVPVDKEMSPLIG